jgi:outer membrane receptor protein involved in Fe transport
MATKQNWLTLLATLLALNLNAQVQTDSTLFDLSLEELLNMRITSASKFEQSLRDAPSNISVITRKQIQQFGWISTDEVLSRMPGFAMSQDFEKHTISSRGVFESWNGNHMLSLMDGVPMNLLFVGSSLSSEVTPLVLTKSLEVIRGPGSALYGSNATNGVISYQSVTPDDLSTPVEIRLRRGNWNTTVFDFITGITGKNVSVVSAFNFFETDGHSYESLDATNTQRFAIDNYKSSYYFFNKVEGVGKFAGWSFQHHDQAWDFSTGHGWLSMVPDVPENMNEGRRLFVLKYKTPSQEKKLSHEYVMKYQHNFEKYLQRFFPQGDAYYTYGLTEILKSSFNDYFGRSQWTYALGKKANVLGGLEYNYFDYRGDDLHLSNVYLDGDYSPTENNQLVKIGSYLPWLEGHAYQTAGVFAQFNATLIPSLSATLGLRYDRAWFKYNDLYEEGIPVRSKSLSKLNPRLSLVYTISPKATIKAMAGSAFRSPSPFELFVGNSYNGTSNLKELKPENVRTYELEADIEIINGVLWRMNAFRTEVDDVIAYGSGNVLINLFSVTTAGFETELQFRRKGLDGFINYSLAKRINEGRADELITIHPQQMTWYPSHLANLGLSYNKNKFNLSSQVHYQGVVNRRESDQSTELNILRGNEVAAWTTVDVRAYYQLTKEIRLGVQANNLFDSKGYYLKTYANPFDYQIPGRRMLVDLTIRL